MKKNKKTQKQKSGKKATSKAEEPVTYYATSSADLNVLAEMNSIELDNIKLPGSALLDIQEETALSAMDLAGIVGVSKSKYYDLIKLDNLDAKNIDALADFAVLWQKGMEAFDSDQAMLNEWLETKNTNLGGVKPIDLLSTRVGRRELEKAFQRIEYSVYG